MFIQNMLLWMQPDSLIITMWMRHRVTIEKKIIMHKMAMAIHWFAISTMQMDRNYETFAADFTDLLWPVMDIIGRPFIRTLWTRNYWCIIVMTWYVNETTDPRWIKFAEWRRESLRQMFACIKLRLRQRTLGFLCDKFKWNLIFVINY